LAYLNNEELTMTNKAISIKAKSTVKNLGIKTGVKAGGSLGDVVDEIVKDPTPVVNGGVGDIID
jgi:hypothetical protein